MDELANHKLTTETSNNLEYYDSEEDSIDEEEDWSNQCKEFLNDVDDEEEEDLINMNEDSKNEEDLIDLNEINKHATSNNMNTDLLNINDTQILPLSMSNVF